MSTTAEKVKLPSIRSYGNYASSNYGAHCLQVEVGDITVYFSYQTPVAFHSYRHGLVCLKNQWGTTTGKHLNLIEPDHKKRIDQETFDRLFQEAMEN